ncbi:Kinesin light chain [Nymphaea thermarum]|nr:Kinesin light chain [Nymphaea thermarum]
MLSCGQEEYSSGHTSVDDFVCIRRSLTCAAFFFGISGSPILSENISSTDMGIESESATGKAYVYGLQKIEDDSVISNIHTSKWRVFTDNARDLYVKAIFYLVWSSSFQGKLDEAEKYFLLALQEAKEGFGESDPHVASACNNLAEFYRVQKAYEKAEPLYLESIGILESSLGPEDVRVAFALHNLGGFYFLQHKFEKARLCYEVLHLLGDLKDSEALIQDSIRILEGWDSLDAIAARENLALILQSDGRLNEAEELFERCLKIRKELLSLDHAQLGKGRSAAEAQKQYLRSLKGLRSILTRQDTQESEGKLRKVEEEIKRVENEIQSSGRNKK